MQEPQRGSKEGEKGVAESIPSEGRHFNFGIRFRGRPSRKKKQKEISPKALPLNGRRKNSEGGDGAASHLLREVSSYSRIDVKGRMKGEQHSHIWQCEKIEGGFSTTMRKLET